MDIVIGTVTLLVASLFWLFAIVWLTEIGRGAHPFGWFRRRTDRPKP